MVCPGTDFVDFWSQSQTVTKSRLLGMSLSIAGANARKSLNRASQPDSQPASQPVSLLMDGTQVQGTPGAFPLTFNRSFTKNVREFAQDSLGGLSIPIW